MENRLSMGRNSIEEIRREFVILVGLIGISPKELEVCPAGFRGFYGENKQEVQKQIHCIMTGGLTDVMVVEGV